jgi:hypothetical protein
LIKGFRCCADNRGMSLATPPVAAVQARQLRWGFVAALVATVVALSVIVSGIVSWIIRSNDDPFRTAPELEQQVWEYTMLPLIGTTSEVGNVEIVTMAVTPMEDGRWGVHLILRSTDGLPRYGTRIAPADSRAAPSSCAASGPSGWGECYVTLSGARGTTVQMELSLDREAIGGFPIHLEPWGSEG